MTEWHTWGVGGNKVTPPPLTIFWVKHSSQDDLSSFLLAIELQIVKKVRLITYFIEVSISSNGEISRCLQIISKRPPHLFHSIGGRALS